MTQFGKIIAIAGALLLIVGTVTWALGRLGFRRLPGDIRHDGGEWRIHVPIITCIVISIVLTIVINIALWLWNWLQR
jgi:uncharacterized membrane protein YidH (DUF202 family)